MKNLAFILLVMWTFLCVGILALGLIAYVDKELTFMNTTSYIAIVIFGICNFLVIEKYLSLRREL